jgi:hypothetical protein
MRPKVTRSPVDRFLPHCRFPNAIISDEIAAVLRVTLSLHQARVGGSGVEETTEAMS